MKFANINNYLLTTCFLLLVGSFRLFFSVSFQALASYSIKYTHTYIYHNQFLINSSIQCMICSLHKQLISNLIWHKPYHQSSTKLIITQTKLNSHHKISTTTQLNQTINKSSITLNLTQIKSLPKSNTKKKRKINQ